METKECPAKIEITAHPYGTSRDGCACSVSGGHCVPDNECDGKRKHLKDRAAILTSEPRSKYTWNYDGDINNWPNGSP